MSGVLVENDRIMSVVKHGTPLTGRCFFPGMRMGTEYRNHQIAPGEYFGPFPDGVFKGGSITGGTICVHDKYLMECVDDVVFVGTVILIYGDPFFPFKGNLFINCSFKGYASEESAIRTLLNGGNTTSSCTFSELHIPPGLPLSGGHFWKCTFEGYTAEFEPAKGSKFLNCKFLDEQWLNVISLECARKSGILFEGSRFTMMCSTYQVQAWNLVWVE